MLPRCHMPSDSARRTGQHITLHRIAGVLCSPDIVLFVHHITPLISTPQLGIALFIASDSLPHSYMQPCKCSSSCTSWIAPVAVLVREHEDWRAMLVSCCKAVYVTLSVASQLSLLLGRLYPVRSPLRVCCGCSFLVL